jgi:hypothetical protein
MAEYRGSSAGGNPYHSFRRRGYGRRKQKNITVERAAPIPMPMKITPLSEKGGARGRCTYTAMVMNEHMGVSHDLYLNDQFCGLAGSSQVTKIGSESVLGWGRKGTVAATRLASSIGNAAVCHHRKPRFAHRYFLFQTDMLIHGFRRPWM